MFSSLAAAALLITHTTQALRPFQLPSQLVLKTDEAPHNGSAVPGLSPVKYHNNPSNDIFQIESLDMYPNPCVIESYCTVLVHGEFTTSLANTTPHLSFNATSHLPNGREGLVPGEDAFCNWVDIIQDDENDDAYTQINPPHPNYPGRSPSSSIQRKLNRKDKLSCPPKKGKAQISSTILLLGGYVPEANFTVKVKATEEGMGGRTIFDLWTSFELQYKE